MNLSKSSIRLTPNALTLAILMGVSGCSEAPQQEVTSSPFHKVTQFRRAHRGHTYPPLEGELTDSQRQILPTRRPRHGSPASTTASTSDAITEAPLPGPPQATQAIRRNQQECRAHRKKTPLLPGFCRSVLKNWPPSIEMPEDLSAPVADEEGVVYKEQIPEAIHALNQKTISLKGFMLPLKVEQGLVTEMLIMRDQSMCCYGTVPKINEWVSVRMAEEASNPSWMSL